MSLLTEEQKQNAIRSRVYSVIKFNMRKWYNDKQIYTDDIYDLQCILNSVLDKKYHFMHEKLPDKNNKDETDIFVHIPVYNNDQLTKQKHQTGINSTDIILVLFDEHKSFLTNTHVLVLKEWLEIKGLW
jgi:hypothetical protein